MTPTEHLGSIPKSALEESAFRIKDDRLEKYLGSSRIVYIPSGITSIGNHAFCRCTSLTSAVIPEGVTTIGDCAFEGCRSLESVSVPSTVTSIGEAAFCGCRSLSSVEVPAGVTVIGDCAFNGCVSLASIFIPSSVTSIGRFAFWGCTSLKSVSPRGNPTTDQEQQHIDKLRLEIMLSSFIVIRNWKWVKEASYRELSDFAKACGCGKILESKIDYDYARELWNEYAHRILGNGHDFTTIVERAARDGRSPLSQLTKSLNAICRERCLDESLNSVLAGVPVEDVPV